MPEGIRNRLLNRDARLLSRYIKKPMADVIITSPPYFDMKDYGVNGQIGFGQDYQTEFLADLKQVFHDCYTITKRTGSLWVVADTLKRNGRLLMLPFHISEVLKDIGWILRDIIVWDKGKTLPWSHRGQFRNTFEYILFLSKTENYKYYVNRIKENDLKEWWIRYPERYNPEGKTPANIWHIPIPVQGSWSNNKVKHLCPFPEKLVERILLLTTDEGDLVVDPFAGSGVVLAQAYSMKRKYVGFEIRRDYVDSFRMNVAKEVKSRWKARGRKYIDTVNRQREDLKDKIIRLRAVKYPFSLVRQFLKNYHSEGDDTPIILFLVALYREAEADEYPASRIKIIKEDIFIIVGDEENKDLMATRLMEVADKPPLSKFGVHGVVKVVSKDSLTSWLSHRSDITDRDLWIYVGGVNYKYHKKANLKEGRVLDVMKELKTMWKNNLPPVICNVRIKLSYPQGEEDSGH